MYTAKNQVVILLILFLNTCPKLAKFELFSDSIFTAFGI